MNSVLQISAIHKNNIEVYGKTYDVFVCEANVVLIDILILSFSFKTLFKEHLIIQSTLASMLMLL